MGHATIVMGFRGGEELDRLRAVGDGTAQVSGKAEGISTAEQGEMKKLPGKFELPGQFIILRSLCVLLEQVMRDS
jgi:hypothetical protein